MNFKLSHPSTYFVSILKFYVSYKGTKKLLRIFSKKRVIAVYSSTHSQIQSSVENRKAFKILMTCNKSQWWKFHFNSKGASELCRELLLSIQAIFCAELKNSVSNVADHSNWKLFIANNFDSELPDSLCLIKR